MSVHIAQAKLKTEGVPEVQEAAKKMFSALNAAHPEGIRYAWVLFPDGETFAALVQADDGAENALLGLPEFRELQEVVRGSLVKGPDVQPLTVIGSYGLF